MPTVAESFPADLVPQPCWRCKTIVVYVNRTPTREHGTRPVAVQLAPAGVVGNVAIETSLIACGGCICGYETNLPTRYTWHGPICELQAETRDDLGFRPALNREERERAGFDGPPGVVRPRVRR